MSKSNPRTTMTIKSVIVTNGKISDVEFEDVYKMPRSINTSLQDKASRLLDEAKQAEEDGMELARKAQRLRREADKILGDNHGR